uniref:Uncharacterized protein n=1 Tax=Anguilla anguilla TaxID=7936 RepID=A0A0E9WTY5_ANGAN
MTTIVFTILFTMNRFECILFAIHHTCYFSHVYTHTQTHTHNNNCM